MVVTLRSDTDPDGHPQLGAPINPGWELILPKLHPRDTCKVLAYAHKALVDNCLIHNRLDHPLATLHSLILDIVEDDMVAMQVINVYHPPPQTRQHGLGYLFCHPLDDLTPIVTAKTATH